MKNFVEHGKKKKIINYHLSKMSFELFEVNSEVKINQNCLNMLNFIYAEF